MPDDVGPSARHLISQLLCLDPKQRITAGAAINHPWLAKYSHLSIDINKLRFNSSILISNRPEDDVDEQTLKELELFGLDRNELVRLIMTKTHSSTATLYYLLLNHVINKRILLGGPKLDSSTPILNPNIHRDICHFKNKMITNNLSPTSIVRYGISQSPSAELSADYLTHNKDTQISVQTAHPCEASQPAE